MDNYKKLLQKPYEVADLMYRYAQRAVTASKDSFDYGTGESYTSTEVHTITWIDKHPGITVTEFAVSTRRTKATVSQMISKLEKQGLIYKERQSSDTKKQKLFLTPKGLKLSALHIQYDEAYMADSLNELISVFGLTAVQKYLDILEYLSNVETDPTRSNKNMEIEKTDNRHEKG